MYNPKISQHFWTTDGNEKQALIHSGWNYEGIGWTSPSSGTPIYRLYSLSGSHEHIYTTSIAEKNNLSKHGYHYEAIFGYSGGNIPVYRLYHSVKPHMYTTSMSEVKGLERQNYKLEEIAFYSIAPEYSWSNDMTYSNYSGQTNDVHYPQFVYLTNTEGHSTSYQGNNIFYAYNDAVFNFNAKLAQDATTADYQNQQARQNYENEINQDNVAVDNAKALLANAQTKLAEAGSLVAQAQTYVNNDATYNLDAAQDNVLLAQRQANQGIAQSVVDTDNAALQTATQKLTTLQNDGTDFVQLNFISSYSNGGKTVTISFTKTAQTNGVSNKTNFVESATLSAD